MMIFDWIGIEIRSVVLKGFFVSDAGALLAFITDHWDQIGVLDFLVSISERLDRRDVAVARSAVSTTLWKTSEPL
jgi:hypothetical protein